MDSKILNNVEHFFSLTLRSLLFCCAWLTLTLICFSGCAHTDCGYEENCSTISCRVKKCFLFHTDKCSPLPYFAFDGYQKDLDRFVVKHAAKKCAHASLKNMECNCAEKPSKAFRKGYRQAYIDIALGDSGEVPPVPPARYWAAHYRTPAGYMEIQEWFTGYKLGAEHAHMDGRFEYNKIATPYSLAGWDQSVSNQWEENGDTGQIQPEPEVGMDYTPPAPMGSPNPIPEPPANQPAPAPALAPAPAPAVAPAPAPQSTKPTQTIPQRQLPPPPQVRHHQTQPRASQHQIQKQRPQVAPKPVPQAHSTVKIQRPEVQQPKIPVYRNDDPPPNPYSLQSYPYTPLPNHKPSVNQYRQLDYLNTPNYQYPDYQNRQ